MKVIGLNESSTKQQEVEAEAGFAPDHFGRGQAICPDSGARKRSCRSIFCYGLTFSRKTTVDQLTAIENEGHQ